MFWEVFKIPCGHKVDTFFKNPRFFRRMLPGGLCPELCPRPDLLYFLFPLFFIVAYLIPFANRFRIKASLASFLLLSKTCILPKHKTRIGVPDKFLNGSWVIPCIKQIRYNGVPLRYNKDKREKPVFSRGLSVCRSHFNSFSNIETDAKN